MTFQFALCASAVLVGSAGLIRALEDWWNRAAFADHGIMSAAIVGLQWAGPGGAPMRVAGSYALVRLCILLRVAAALGLAAAPVLPTGAVAVLLAANACLLAFFLLRCGYGADGADQMLIIVSVGTALAAGPAGAVRGAGQWLITGQLVLSFFIAGAAKLAGADWRSGRALRGILTTDRYGTPALGRLVSRHGVATLALGWGVMLMEVSFPVTLLGIRELTLAFLVAGLVFHFGVAAAMGLNNFFLTFAAAYPVAAYTLVMPPPR
ncbi:hypothetical protein EDD29_4502 [Actinocorallia herbida]|uniref:HTTM-like domain-containing protein n=1 Tax=Actinocorallia herbida TaxID=58109 RepID=A0A3N1D1I1_9ACTN|nr:hypothetical protein [Actinocorallia herbida]ROO86918.1 hypothetical protein EDD29_4502 [Actinocorallia herbida]